MSQQNKKAKPANQKSKLLGDVEHRCLFQLIGNRCVVSCPSRSAVLVVGVAHHRNVRHIWQSFILLPHLVLLYFLLQYKLFSDKCNKKCRKIVNMTLLSKVRGVISHK